MRRIHIVLSLLSVGLVCSGCLVRLERHTSSLGASGVVLDSQTQASLHGASVAVPDYAGRERPFVTREGGRFSIRPVRGRHLVILMGDFAHPGHTLIVRRDGYDPVSIDLAVQQTN